MGENTKGEKECQKRMLRLNLFVRSADTECTIICVKIAQQMIGNGAGIEMQ